MLHFNNILELIYPQFCKMCDKKLDSNVELCFCEVCLRKMKIVKPPYCFRCGLPLSVGDTCGRCLSEKYIIKNIRAVYVYEGVAKIAIHEFKYKAKLKLGNVIGNLFVDEINMSKEIKDNIISKVDCIVAVPLHNFKLREREFNQSMIFADKISVAFDIPVLQNSLTRVKNTVSQSSLSIKKRRKNIRGAFRSFSVVKNKSVLLIDDVITTSFTVEECAKELIRAGAREVRALSFARAM